MYAIFENGNKQYKVKNGQIIRLEKINKKLGDIIKFTKILMISDKRDVKIGNPIIKNFLITAKIIKQSREKKIKIIKFKRRKHSCKKYGHRQFFTEVKIIDIKNTI